MKYIDLVERLAEMRRQYDDAHRPTRTIEQYCERHARRHPAWDYDREPHVSQYQTRH
jgi:hypothetical protein